MFSKKFVFQAKSAGQNSEAPDEAWLLEHLQEIRFKKGAGYTRRYARNIAHYLDELGRADIMSARPIRVVLYAPDNMDGMSIDPEDPSAPIGRAQAFADAAYAPATLQGHMTVCKSYLEYCENSGANFLDTSGEFVACWLALYAKKARSFSAVRNARNALSSLFRKNGVTDHARSPEVTLVVDGVKQMRPPEIIRPFTASERLMLVTCLEAEGLGVRDRVIVLMSSFGAWGCDKIALTDASGVTFTADGVEITNGAKAPLVIGRHSNVDLDLEPWMRKLIELVGPTGPLFQAIDKRTLRFSGLALSNQRINRVLLNTAKRAGLESKDTASRLRALFEMECGDVASSIVRRHYGVSSRRRDDLTEEMRAANLLISRKRRPEAYQ